MASSPSHLLVFFLAILFFHSSESSSDLIDKICKRQFAYEFCVKALGSDNDNCVYTNCLNTSLLNLTKTSIDLLLRNASDTRAFIEPMIKNTTDLKKKKCLSKCYGLYDTSVESAKWAKKLLLEGNKEPDWVDLYLENTGVYARLCNDSLTFSGFNEWPILARNTNLFLLSLISEDVFTIMLHPDLLG